MCPNPLNRKRESRDSRRVLTHWTGTRTRASSPIDPGNRTGLVHSDPLNGKHDLIRVFQSNEQETGRELVRPNPLTGNRTELVHINPLNRKQGLCVRIC